MANRAIEESLKSRLFAYLGKRKNVIKEHSVSGYKCDLYIEDTDTIIEIKSVISTADRALFPTVYSERTIKQLQRLQEILIAGKKVCFYVVSLHPYLKEVAIDQNTEFYTELQRCINFGMRLHAYTVRLKGNTLSVEHEIPISFIADC